MKKIRWLFAEWPLPISNISKKLLSNQYSERKGQGFLLSSTGNNRITGKYVEKTTKKSVIVDPFGNETESIITSYYVSKFKIESSSRFLELSDPPRSLRRFISELHILLGLGLELSELSVDPLFWLDNIESSLAPVTVTHISSSGIRVPKYGLAQISVSGKKDIRQEFSKLIDGKPCNIDSIKFVGHIGNCHVSTELSKTGAAKISGHVYDGFIDGLKMCLENSINRR